MRNTELKNRNLNIDFLRVLSCAAVVGLHTLGKSISPWNHLLYYCCGFAVPVFFMTSGYILLNRKSTSFKYSLGKAGRILRVVLFWSAFTVVDTRFLRLLRWEPQGNPLKELVMTGWDSLIQKGRLWQMWYLGALILVYFLLPLLSRIRDKLCWLWFVTFLIGFVIQIASYCMNKPLQENVIQTFRLWTWLQYFMLGGLIGSGEAENMPVLRSFSKVSKYTWWLGIVFAASVSFQYLAGKYLINNAYAEFFYDSAVIAVWVFLLFMWAMSRKNLKAELIRFISPLTMGIYLIHPLLYRFVKFYYKPDSLWTSILFFVFIFSVSAAIVYLMKKLGPLRWLVEL